MFLVTTREKMKKKLVLLFFVPFCLVAFSHNGLSRIDLSNGRLTEHSVELLEGLSDEQLSLVKEFDISENFLSNIPPRITVLLRRMKELYQLDLSKNKFEYLDSAYLLTNASVLRLGSNRLKSLHGLRLEKLRSLLLENNCLVNLDGIQGCNNVTELFLEKNPLSSEQTALDCLDKLPLEVLSISGSRILPQVAQLFAQAHPKICIYHVMPTTDVVQHRTSEYILPGVVSQIMNPGGESPVFNRPHRHKEPVLQAYRGFLD
jgi:hypothetical protein